MARFAPSRLVNCACQQGGVLSGIGYALQSIGFPYGWLVRWLGVFLGCLGVAGWLYAWYLRQKLKLLFSAFVEQILKVALGDVVDTFKLTIEEGGRCTPTGANAFWVAEVEGEVVGCVGMSASITLSVDTSDKDMLMRQPR